MSTELTIRVTRMIPPIAKFKLVHESYSLLDYDSSNTGVMIDVSWKEHDFRVPMCWMMRLETNAYKKFIRFFEDKNTSEEMREIISKLRVQFDAKVGFSLWTPIGKEALEVGWSPRNFKIFFFKPCHFWRKITKMITRLNSRIFTNAPYIWFPLFSWKWPFGNGFFREKFKNSYIGRIRKHPRIHPSYPYCDFPSKMTI